MRAVRRSRAARAFSGPERRRQSGRPFLQVAPEITGLAWKFLRDKPSCCFFLLGDADYWRMRNPGIAVRQIGSAGEAHSIFATALRDTFSPSRRSPLASLS